jgi:hypothetical protein
VPLEKGEKAKEALENVKETEKIDQATFGPEAVVEQDGDYHQTEAIEQIIETQEQFDEPVEV